MSLLIWILFYVLISLKFKWIISWGGAESIKGWKSIFFFDLGNSEEWNTEQLRAMALLLWICFSILFVVGLIYPELRFYKHYS